MTADIPPSDALARAFAGHRLVVELLLAPVDAPSRAWAAHRSVSESIPAPSDSPSYLRGWRRLVVENLPALHDSVAVPKVGRWIGEHLPALVDVVTIEGSVVAGFPGVDGTMTGRVEVPSAVAAAVIGTVVGNLRRGSASGRPVAASERGVQGNALGASSSVRKPSTGS